METNEVFFHIKSDPDAFTMPENVDDLPDDVRFIKYDFGAKFLKLKTVGTR